MTEERPASIETPVQTSETEHLVATDEPNAVVLSHDEIARAEDFSLGEQGGEGVQPSVGLGQGGFGQIDEHSGSYAYSVPIFTPRPLGGGPTPSLTLTYNSQASSRSTEVAPGWRLEMGRITREPNRGQQVSFRNDQGTAEATDLFQLQLDGRSITLVRFAGGPNLFRAKFEGSYIEAERILSPDHLDPMSKEPEIDHWIVRTGNGRVYRYGTPGGAGDRPVAGQVQNKQWALSEVTDPHGRRVVFDYEQAFDPNSPHPEIPVSYPARVRIGGRKASEESVLIEFVYTSDDAPDAEDGYGLLGTEYTGRSTVGVLRRRLVAVRSLVIASGAEPVQVRELRILASTDPRREHFLVRSIQELGFREGVVDPTCVLPAHRFEYTRFDTANPVLMIQSISPLGLQHSLFYDLAIRLDDEAIALEGTVLCHRFEEKADDEVWAKAYRFRGGRFHTSFGEYRGHRETEVHDLETGCQSLVVHAQTGVHSGRPLREERRDALGRIQELVEHTWSALDYGGGRFLPFSPRTETRRYAEDGKTVIHTSISTLLRDASLPWGFALDAFGNELIREERVFRGDPEKGAPLLVARRTERSFVSKEAPNGGRFVGLETVCRVFAKAGEADLWTLAGHTEHAFDDLGQETETVKFQEAERRETSIVIRQAFHPSLGLPVALRRLNDVGEEDVLVTEYYESGPFLGLSARETNPFGHVKHFLRYDEEVRAPTLVQNYDGGIVRIRYDGLGRVIEERAEGIAAEGLAPMDVKESAAYAYTIAEGDRSIVAVHPETGARTITRFDALDRKVSLEDDGVDGRRIIREHVRYDHRTRGESEVRVPCEAGTTAPASRETRYDDPRLRKTLEVSELGNEIAVRYDGLSEYRTERFRVLDTSGEPTGEVHTRVAGETVKDAADRVVLRAEGAPDDPNRYEVHFAYDALGRIVRVTDNLGVTLRTVDYEARLDDQPAVVMDVDLGRQVFEYDRLGRKIAVQTDGDKPGDTQCVWAYDGADRPVRLVHKVEGTSLRREVTVRYDSAELGKGRPAERHVIEQSPAGTFEKSERYGYDRFGALASVQHGWRIDWPGAEVSRSAELAVHYTHDPRAGGRRTAVHYPAYAGIEGSAIHYAYDARSGAIQGVQHEARSIARYSDFTARGQWQNEELGNGARVRRTLDRRAGWVLSIEASLGDDLLAAYKNRFDTAANLRACARTLPSAKGEPLSTHEAEYDYDGRFQLIGARDHGETRSYTYAPDGRRIGSNGPEGKIDLAYGSAAHRPTTLSGALSQTLTYDAGGRLVHHRDGSGAERHLSPDAAGRLGAVLLKDGAGHTRRLYYGYGVDDERAAAFDAETGNLVLHADKDLDLVFDGDSVHMRIHVHVGDRRIADLTLRPKQAPETRWFVRDHQQTSAVMLGDDGRPTTVTRYAPFGAVLEEHGESSELGHAGLRKDIVNFGPFDQYEVGPRAYDPNLGMFLSPDPTLDERNVGFGYNRYVYARNSPVSSVDPSGFSWLSWIEEKTGIDLLNNPVTNLVLNKSVSDFAAGLGDSLSGIPFTEISVSKGYRVLLSHVTGQDIDGMVDRTSNAYRYGEHASLLFVDPKTLVKAVGQGVKAVGAIAKTGWELLKWASRNAKKVGSAVYTAVEHVAISVTYTALKAFHGVKDGFKWLHQVRMDAKLGKHFDDMVDSARQFLETGVLRPPGSTGMVNKSVSYGSVSFPEGSLYEEGVKAFKKAWGDIDPTAVIEQFGKVFGQQAKNVVKETAKKGSQ